MVVIAAGPGQEYVRNPISGRVHKVSGHANPETDPIGDAFGLVRTWCGTVLYLHPADPTADRGVLVRRFEEVTLCGSCRLRPTPSDGA